MTAKKKSTKFSHPQRKTWSTALAWENAVKTIIRGSAVTPRAAGSEVGTSCPFAARAYFFTSRASRKLDNAAHGASRAGRQSPASFRHGMRRFGFRSFSRVRAVRGRAGEFPALAVVPMRATGVAVRLGCSARAIRYDA